MDIFLLSNAINFTLFISQGINMEAMYYEEIFEDSLKLIKAIPTIIIIQRKFKEWYWTPDGPGGRKIIEKLIKQKI